MISVEEALSLINNENSFLKKEENLPVSECLGRILAKPIVAPINLPSFRHPLKIITIAGSTFVNF